MKTKTRLTITLSKEILSQVDQIIDKKEIKNRSHAIELLVSRAITPHVSEAIVLAGGTKHRFCPLLARINGHFLFSLILDHLKKFGVTQVLLCVGKFESQLKKKFPGNIPGLSLIYLHESRPLGTAGAIRAALKSIKSDTFFVLHGDVLTTINLQDFSQFHQSQGSVATIAVKPRAGGKYGKVILQGDKITEFGLKGDQGISIVNTGIYLFTKEILNYLPQKTPAALEKDVFPHLAKEGDLSGFIFQGVWFDISQKSDLAAAQARWQKEGR